MITALLLIPLAPKVIALTRLEEEVEQQRTDLTHERDERQRLERDLNNFFMLSNDMFCVLDTAGSFQRHNPAWQQTFGYSQDELQAGSFIDFVHVEDQANTLIALENLRDGSDVISFENRFIGNNGCYSWLQWNAVPVPGQGLIYAIARNISEQTATTATLAEEKKLLQVTLHSIGDGVITTDAQGDIAYLNPVAETLTGWSTTEVRKQPLGDVFFIIDEHSRQRMPNPALLCLAQNQAIDPGEHTILINRYGQTFAIQESAAPILSPDQQALGVVIVFRDVTEARRLRQELNYHASHDHLTGLANRREFESQLQRVMETAARDSSTHALCYLDLDEFKIINDTCGHEAGDELLRQLAHLFRVQIRKRDVLSRLGGDEFAVLLEYCTPAEAQRVTSLLLESVRQFQFCWDNQVFRPGVSIGLVPVTAASGSCSEVLRDADGACYVAKEAGRNRVHIMSEQDNSLTQRRTALQYVSKLQQAIEEDNLQLWAQPIVPVRHGANTGLHYEILVRLCDDDGRLISPGVFLPAAERYHQIEHLDRWVISHTLQWLSQNPEHVSQLEMCSINISGQSLDAESFQQFLVQLLDTDLVAPAKICFEITETAAIVSLMKARHFVLQLKERGCRFALDDFGTGLSSFAYLKNLPVDFVKIDGTFVKDIEDDSLNLAMVRSINEIAKLLGKQTIAEFVENDQILTRLRAMGVDYVQGYGVGRPQPLMQLFAVSGAA